MIDPGEECTYYEDEFCHAECAQANDCDHDEDF